MDNTALTWWGRHAPILFIGLFMTLAIVMGYRLHPYSRMRFTPAVVWQEVCPIWPRIFFPSIQEKNRNVGIEDLQNRHVPEGSYEIRVYSGFGLQFCLRGGHPLDLLVLTLSGDTVRSAHYPRSPHGPVTKEHPDPPFWNALCRHGLFDLPDSSKIKDYPAVLDGVSYVVEIKSGEAYRHYKYGNPAHSDSREAKSMVRIINHLKAHTTFETIPGAECQ